MNTIFYCKGCWVLTTTGGKPIRSTARRQNLSKGFLREREKKSSNTSSLHLSWLDLMPRLIKESWPSSLGMISALALKKKGGSGCPPITDASLSEHIVHHDGPDDKQQALNKGTEELDVFNKCVSRRGYCWTQPPLPPPLTSTIHPPPHPPFLVFRGAN